MCNPMTTLAAASAGAQVGGQVMNSNAQAQNTANAINAKNTGTANMIAKENQLSAQAKPIFDSALSTYQGATPGANLGAAQAQNTQVFRNNSPTVAQLAGGATTGNAPQVVQDSENKTIGDRLGVLDTRNQAFGNLTGYDTNNQNNTRMLADTKSKLGTIGDFANEDATVGQALTGAAVANSQKPPPIAGDLLSGIGSIGSYYAGKNGAFNNLFSGSANTQAKLDKIGLY